MSFIVHLVLISVAFPGFEFIFATNTLLDSFVGCLFVDPLIILIVMNEEGCDKIIHPVWIKVGVRHGFSIPKSRNLWNLRHFSFQFVERLLRKLNSAPVCFGAKNNQFGRFQVEFGGSSEAVKLVHLHGFVIYLKSSNAWTKWGWSVGASFKRIFITDLSNTILLLQVT